MNLKGFYLLLIAVLFSVTTYAQDAEQSKNAEDFELGIIGGIGFSNVVGADTGNNGLRLGIHLGGFAEIELGDKLGFRPELHIISVKGTSSGNYRVLYFDFPLLLTYDLNEKFSLIGGAQPSFLLHARTRDRGAITQDIKTIDFGLLIGGWYEIDDTWSVGARFSHSITRDSKLGVTRSYNANFQLSVGYQIF